MSIKLFIILIGLMLANQLMGTTYGTWKKGFNKAVFCSGCYKLGILCLGYGTVAVTARYAGEYIPGAEYISGLLLEPIARYFTKLVETLRNMVMDKVLKDN